MAEAADGKGLATILGSLKKFMPKGKQAGGKSEVSTLDPAVIADKIRKSSLFAKLPEPSVAGIISQMESIAMPAGNAVISEGEEGEHFFLIIGGTAEVVRKVAGGKTGVVATLHEGDGFGEEALISNAKRNATVRMKTNGTLIRLSRNTFNDFIKESVVTWLSPTEAQRKVNEGAKWVDVREQAGGGPVMRLRGSLAAPLSRLREIMGELEKDAFYVCYCENGRMSSTAAFLLVRSGFKAGVMRGGLQGLRRAGLIEG